MVCKKAGSSTSEINTAIGASVLDNIGVHYGEAVRRELVEVVVEDITLGVKAKGWFSGANYGAKKGTFLFFINRTSSPRYRKQSAHSLSHILDRLVDCSPLRRAFDSFYTTLLAKGSHPFVYLSLEISPSKVDVNVHPTKQEVGFEDEEEIVEIVCEALAKKLEKAGDSRSFKVQVRAVFSFSIFATLKSLRCRLYFPDREALSPPLVLPRPQTRHPHPPPPAQKQPRTS